MVYLNHFGESPWGSGKLESEISLEKAVTFLPNVWWMKYEAMRRKKK
jgi:hypothetical protein